MDLEYEWIPGDVGNFWLRVGLNQKQAHVYQTPWTGAHWWADAQLFGLPKQSYATKSAAMEAAESAVDKWFTKAIFRRRRMHRSWALPRQLIEV